MTTPSASASTARPAQAGGLQKKNLVIIGLIVAALWALAIYSDSLVFRIIMGVLTLVIIGGLVWLLRLLSKQKRFSGMLEGAASSPEARRAAIAKLEADKDANDPTNMIARAQLVAADDPKKALEMMEGIQTKLIPAQVQDDYALLLSQLYLGFGRAKDARPLVDKVNLDNPQRKEQRGLMVAVVAEAWARTGKHAEALTLLESVNFSADAQLRIPLLVARTFARFASGKKGAAREDMKLMAMDDVNLLGRFLMPQFRVHPELQRLARQVAESNPEVRRMSASRSPQRRGFR